MRNKQMTSLLVCFVALILIGFGCKSEKKPISETTQPTEQTTAQDEQAPTTDSEKETAATTAIKPGVKEKAVIHTNLGSIELEFYSDVAPKHVENFKKLARDKFYDGSTFHRVVPNFVIQGGDPNSKDDDRSNDGMGGPGYTIAAEFNKRPHKRGTLSMARRQDPNSAGSQFFICLKELPNLDHKYTVFGNVIKGMDVVDRIAAMPRDSRHNPVEKAVMKRVAIEPI